MYSTKGRLRAAVVLVTAVILPIAGFSGSAGAGSPGEPANSAAAPAETRYELAEQCTIDAVPAGRKGGFGLNRRSKPPDYLLPKKEDAQEQQSDPAGDWQDPDLVPSGGGYVDSLTELKGLYDKGLIETQEYEATQVRILTGLDPQKSGVEGGLVLLRQLWDQGLISEAPYALKRQEMLDAL